MEVRMNITHEQKMNMLAIELLEREGFFNPTQEQIDLMETHLYQAKLVSLKSKESYIISHS
jgi:hypothetical protein